MKHHLCLKDYPGQKPKPPRCFTLCSDGKHGGPIVLTGNVKLGVFIAWLRSSELGLYKAQIRLDKTGRKGIVVILPKAGLTNHGILESYLGDSQNFPVLNKKYLRAGSGSYGGMNPD